MSEPLTFDMYVGREHVGARSGRRFDVLNPATGEAYATVSGRDRVDEGSHHGASGRRGYPGRSEERRVGKECRL